MENFTSSFSNTPANSLFVRLILILFLSIFGMLIASLIIQSIGATTGLAYTTILNELQVDSPEEEKNFIRTALCLSHVFRFILPALIFGWMLYKKDWFKKAKLSTLPTVSSIFLGILFIISAFPVAQFIFSVNKSFQAYFPLWAIEQENFISTVTNHLLHVNDTTTLFFNIFTIALLPAIGEELVFRGILQQNFEKDLKNAHWAVWITAVIFSFIHFQFLGFLPRVFLGAVLGYLFVWSRNLWIPILAHFVTNAGQILIQYFNQQAISSLDLEQVDSVPIWLTLLGMVGMGLFGYLSFNKKRFLFTK